MTRSCCAPNDAAGEREVAAGAQLSVLLLKVSDALGLGGAYPRRVTLVDVGVAHPGPDRLDAIPNCCATRYTVPCSVPSSARNARTIRTAAAFSSADEALGDDQALGVSAASLQCPLASR
jgi:hypothetical protein